MPFRVFKAFGDFRQNIRAALRQNIYADLRRRFAGTGRSGQPQWGLALCPRRRRRAIARDAMHRQWRELRGLPPL